MDGGSLQLQQWGAVLMILFLSVLLVLGMLIGSSLVGKKGARTAEKETPYECGMLPTGPIQGRMSVRFYVVAMLFLLFDIELVFLYPWAVTYREFLGKEGGGGEILISVFLFLGVVGVGYLYAWKKGMLDWGKTLRDSLKRQTRTSQDPQS